MKKQYVVCVLFFILFVIGLVCMPRVLAKRTPAAVSYYTFSPAMSGNQPCERTDMYTTVLREARGTPTDSYEKASILLLHKFDDIHKMDKVPIRGHQCVMGIKSIDQLASKARLASIFGKPFPQHVPKTWIFSNKKDLDELYKQFDASGVPLFPMILKKDVQRQTGLNFVTHVADLSKANQNVVCQKVLTNPLLVNHRKINLRLYLLVVCNAVAEMYMFNDGFIYYAPEYYDQKVSFETHVTTGYVDRRIYDTNPLTLQELYSHIGETGAVALQSNLRTIMSDLCRAYSPVITATDCDASKRRKFVILGVDIAPDSKYGVTIMEINKGPDLNEKDERDGALKRVVVRDALAICRVIPDGSKNNYIKLI